MEISVRNAELKDYEAVVDLMNQVHQLHVGWRPDIYRADDGLISPEAFAEMVEGDTLLVAEADGIVAGILELAYRRVEAPGLVPRNVIFIDAMAVDEKYRGMGIGNLLFERVRQLQKREHCDGIELQVDVNNRAAYEMYFKYGFREQSVNMELL